MHPCGLCIRDKGHQILSIFVSNALLKIILGEEFKKPYLRTRRYQNAVYPRCRAVPLLPVQRSREPQSWGLMSPLPHSSPPVCTHAAPLFPSKPMAHRIWVKAHRLTELGAALDSVHYYFLSFNYYYPAFMLVAYFHVDIYFRHLHNPEYSCSPRPTLAPVE